MSGQVFLIDPARQPPKPRTLSRSCADGYMLLLGTIAAAATVGFGIYAILFANGASNWPLTLVVLCLLSALSVHPFGEMILHRNWPVVSYVYFVVQCALTFAIFWAAAMNWVVIPQSLEYIEENWFLLQNTVLIPFTTQLEQKKMFADDQNVLFGLGIVTGVLRLLAVIDAWKGLGGTIRLVQSRFGIILPAYGILFTAAVAALVNDDVAATIAPWAVPYSTATLLWQSAMAGLVIITIVCLTIAGGVWGSSLITHALGVILLAPATLIVAVTSSVTLARSNLVSGFVNANWVEIHQFVPPQYASLQPDKYATAAYTPMAAAAATGIMLAVILLGVVLVHLRCVITLHAVGAELYALARKKTVGGTGGSDDLKTPLAFSGSAATASAGSSVSAGSSGSTSARYSALGSDHPAAATSGGGSSASSLAGHQLEGASLVPYSDADVHHDSGRHTSTASLSGEPMSPGGIEMNGTGSNGRAALAPTPTSPSGSALKSYGTGTGSPRPGDFSTVPLDAHGQPHHTKVHVHGHPSHNLSGSSFGLSDEDYEACKAKATAAYARYLAATGVASDTLLASYHAPWPETALEEKAKTASKRGLIRAVGTEMKGTAITYMCCLIPTLLAVIVTIAGMGAGLGQLAAVGTCGVLARAPASITYATSFDVAPGVLMAINNAYPYGSIEIIAPHFQEASDHNVSVEVTYYAASSGDLPTYSQFMGALNETGYDPRHEPIGSDDNVGGYWFSTLSLSPPPSDTANYATKACLGARIRIYTAAHMIQASVTSSRAIVNITGNVGDVDLTKIDKNSVAPIFSSLQINTDVAPVVLNKVYADPFVPFEPVSKDYNLRVTSNMGDVTLTTTLAPGVSVTTGGTIRSSNVVSASLTFNCQSGCGNVDFKTTGAGRISVSQAVLANNAAFTSDAGVIVLANTGLIIGKRVDINSSSGKVYMSNYIQASGNETYVNAANDVAMSAVFANQLFVTVTGSAKVSVVEAFMGLTTTTLVKPYIVGNYSEPVLSITTDRGDIGVLGFSGNSNFANVLSVYMTSNLGDIRVEVNGGGYNGNYTASSNRGTTTVEIDGRAASASGVLGEGSSGRNVAIFHTDAGDVSMTELASPL